MRKAAEVQIGAAKSFSVPWPATGFACVTICLLVFFHTPLMKLLSLAFAGGHDADQYSHIALIPILTGYLILRRRRQIFAETDFAIGRGIGVLTAGGVVLSIVELVHGMLNEHDHL